MGPLGASGEGRDDSRSHDDPKGKDGQAQGNDDAKLDLIPRVSTLCAILQGRAGLPVD